MRTKTIKTWGYDNEHSFVMDALTNPQKREDFKSFTRVIVENTAQFYIDFHHLDTKMLPILINAGLDSFDKAFSNYVRLPKAKKGRAFLFSTYYIWWLKIVYDDFLQSQQLRQEK